MNGSAKATRAASPKADLINVSGLGSGLGRRRGGRSCLQRIGVDISMVGISKARIIVIARVWCKCRAVLCDSDFLRQINVLNCVQQLDAFIHRPLKSLAPGNWPMPPPRLLMTAVRTAAAKSPEPFDSPPELIRPMRPMYPLAT